MKLTDFGVKVEKHVVASKMVKFGKTIGCAHHMCYAHVMHLAIFDVLTRSEEERD